MSASESPQQPEGSTVQVERAASGVTLTIPPAGLLKGSGGIFAFALVWCGGVGLITAIMLLAADRQPGQLLPMLGFMSLFWLAGVGLLLAAINMGSRRAVIAVVDGELLVLQTGLFRSKSRTWPAGQVAAVRHGPGSMKVNDRPVPELQIVSLQGDKFGMLVGRDEEELAWMAAEIREALSLSELDEHEVRLDILGQDVDQPPSDSRIELETFPTGLALDIPPAGIWRGSHGFVGLGLFLLAAMTGVTAVEAWFGMSVRAHPIGALFTLLGWAAGVAVLVAGAAIGTPRAAIAVSKRQLLITQSSLLGAKRREYAAGEVAAIRAAPSGKSDDLEGLVELQVLSTEGEKQVFLVGQRKDELLWIATLLRQALDVPATTDDEDLGALDPELDGEEEDEEVEDEEQ